MISARDGLWIANTFKCTGEINDEHNERLTRAAIEFSKAIFETTQDCPQRTTALTLLVSSLRAAECAAVRRP